MTHFIFLLGTGTMLSFLHFRLICRTSTGCLACDPDSHILSSRLYVHWWPVIASLCQHPPQRPIASGPEDTKDLEVLGKRWGGRTSWKGEGGANSPLSNLPMQLISCLTQRVSVCALMRRYSWSRNVLSDFVPLHLERGSPPEESRSRHWGWYFLPAPSLCYVSSRQTPHLTFFIPPLSKIWPLSQSLVVCLTQQKPVQADARCYSNVPHCNVSKVIKGSLASPHSFPLFHPN